jgi:hypothetical protein
MHNIGTTIRGELLGLYHNTQNYSLYLKYNYFNRRLIRMSFLALKYLSRYSKGGNTGGLILR